MQEEVESCKRIFHKQIRKAKRGLLHDARSSSARNVDADRAKEKALVTATLRKLQEQDKRRQVRRCWPQAQQFFNRAVNTGRMEHGLQKCVCRTSSSQRQKQQASGGACGGTEVTLFCCPQPSRQLRQLQMPQLRSGKGVGCWQLV